MQDITLMKYIDQVFAVYDADHSGKLNEQQLHLFFNDIFKRMDDPRRFTNQQVKVLFNEADVNHDGGVDKPQLLKIFKKILAKNPYKGTYTTYIAPASTYTYTYYVQRPKITTSSYKVTTTTTYSHY